MNPPPQSFELRLIDRNDPAVLAALLEVYRQCEDFLALGPQPHASPEMVQADLDLSQSIGSLFYGIYAVPSGELMGVADYLLSGYEGNPQHAFLELLMIARPFRNHGLGRRVAAQIEAHVRQNPRVKAIRAGVQDTNLAAIRFWQRCGYNIIGPVEHFPDQTSGYPTEKRLD
jgi:ribosomal protein S18 acetylase RimI-like enzyme